MTEKTKKFLQKLKDSGNWNDDHDYSLVEYINNSTKVKIKCLTHGIFGQIPSSLLRGRGGCTKCSRKYKPTNKEFLQNLKDSGYWDDNCDYSNVDYISANKAVIIIDKNFNTEHKIRPRGLLKGIKCSSNNVIEYLLIEEAKKFVHKLGLNSVAEWEEYRKSGKKPHNIASNPRIIYKNKGWVSMGDWLGTGKVADQLKEYMPFEEGREFVRKLGLKTASDYTKWHDKNKPINLPKQPNNTYKNKGWISWRDWVGNEDLSNIEKSKLLLSFEKAREFAKKLGFETYKEWDDYCKSGNKPNNIPSCPDQRYKDKFIGYPDFLGYLGNGKHQWYKSYILDFLKSLQNELINLPSVELITIINSNNLAKKLKEFGYLEDLVCAQSGSKSRKEILDNIMDVLEKTDESKFDDEEIYNEKINKELQFTEKFKRLDKSDVTEEYVEELLPNDPIENLKMYDKTMITASLDDENLDFLIKNPLKGFWNEVLNDETYIEKLKNENGGERFEIIKKMFFDEYNEVSKINIPEDYIFNHEPTLMQKLVSYRLMKERVYGNWSGVGAGKTLSSILAGRLAKCKNTLVICNNSIVDGWVKSINEYFKNNNIYVKKYLENVPPNSYNILNDKYDINLPNNKNNYLIINYETFQQPDREYIISQLFKNNIINYVILDEVQNVKQRDPNQSKRREAVNKLLIKAREINENLYFMSMSATPITNELYEPKKLIELLTGKLHNELDIKESIVNGIEMYKALTRYGLRYIPKYDISINENKIEIDGSHLKEEIKKIPKGLVTEFEKCLLKTKLDAIKKYIKKGTLIYTYYVTQIIYEIGDYIKDLGFTVGYFTGEDKSGLNLFKQGKIDVLIGSSPVGTGVDGIQKVCDTLIPICVPWTSSEYNQLIGRINRKGSNFKKVNVYIPQIIIETDKGQWSWDKRRFNIVDFKATLSDLVIDGRVPKNLLPSRSKMVKDAQQEIIDWINRIEKNDIITFDREQLKLPLNPELVEKLKRKLGDFSQLNKTWSISHSKTTKERLEKEPEEWYHYHTLYEQARENWPEIPYIEISKKIKHRPDWVIGDFGCGENLLANELPNNKFYSFDYIAVNDKVISCDMSNVPLDNNTLDVAVFSLSLMGTNYKDYLKEAYRTLKPFGHIFISEPSSKWERKEDELKKILEEIGFKCFNTIRNTNRFIYLDGIKY